MYDFEAVASINSRADPSENASRVPLLTPVLSGAPLPIVSPTPPPPAPYMASAFKDKRRSVRQHSRVSLPSSEVKLSSRPATSNAASVMNDATFVLLHLQMTSSSLPDVFNFCPLPNFYFIQAIASKLLSSWVVHSGHG
jgi:hypothetical protein